MFVSVCISVLADKINEEERSNASSFCIFYLYITYYKHRIFNSNYKFSVKHCLASMLNAETLRLQNYSQKYKQK